MHRDIKPANLLVDGRGQAVGDRLRPGPALQTDAGLTMTGDLLGTLRYMSPEQALARHGLVDHRTDIYSLGATLYELLTRRPAFEGQRPPGNAAADRRGGAAAAAQVEPAVPRDLETIVLKALEQNPAERYATAQELADDLRRFLEDKPILAKRPTLPQRARKWGQRHRHLVGAAALFLALAVVGLAVSAFLLWRKRNKPAKRWPWPAPITPRPKPSGNGPRRTSARRTGPSKTCSARSTRIRTRSR